MDEVEGYVYWLNSGDSPFILGFDLSYSGFPLNHISPKYPAEGSENKKIELFLKNILKDLNSLKAVDTKLIDIKNRSALADYLVIASGNSSRHLNSITSNLIKSNKKKIISSEGLKSTDWSILDFGDIILNIFKYGNSMDNCNRIYYV